MPKEIGLSGRQRALIASADWVCATVGPPAATEEILSTIGAATKFAWVVKHDPRAMSPQLAARFAARADLICHSLAEADFLAAAMEEAGESRQARIVIETHGRSGAAFRVAARPPSSRPIRSPWTIRPALEIRSPAASWPRSLSEKPIRSPSCRPATALPAPSSKPDDKTIESSMT